MKATITIMTTITNSDKRWEGVEWEIWRHAPKSIMDGVWLKDDGWMDGLSVVFLLPCHAPFSVWSPFALDLFTLLFFFNFFIIFKIIFIFLFWYFSFCIIFTILFIVLIVVILSFKKFKNKFSGFSFFYYCFYSIYYYFQLWLLFSSVLRCFIKNIFHRPWFFKYYFCFYYYFYDYYCFLNFYLYYF